MLSQQQIIQQIAQLKPFLQEKYHVEKIGLFGSFAQNHATETSDIDILVEFSPPLGWSFFDLEELLEQTFHRKIDLVTINSLKPQLREQILKQVAYV